MTNPPEVITIWCPHFGKKRRQFFTFNNNLVTIDRVDNGRCEVRIAQEIGVRQLKTLAKLITLASVLYEARRTPDDYHDRAEELELPF